MFRLADCGQAGDDGTVNRNKFASITLTAVLSLGVPLVSTTAAQAISVTETADPIDIGGSIYDTETQPNGKFVWVSDNDHGAVSVINAKSKQLSRSIELPAGADPTGIAISTNGAFAYIADYNLNYVHVYDIKKQRLLDGYEVSGRPCDVQVSTNGKFAIVGGDAGIVNKINLKNGVVTELTLGGAPWQIALTKNSKRAFVVDNVNNRVVVLNTQGFSQITTINAFSDPYWAELNSDGSQLWVADNGSNEVKIVNTETYESVASVVVGTGPQSLKFTKDGEWVWVLNYTAGSVSIIDSGAIELISTETIGGNPYTMSFSNNGKTAFVADQPELRFFTVSTGL